MIDSHFSPVQDAFSENTQHLQRALVSFLNKRSQMDPASSVRAMCAHYSIKEFCCFSHSLSNAVCQRFLHRSVDV